MRCNAQDMISVLRFFKNAVQKFSKTEYRFCKKVYCVVLQIFINGGLKLVHNGAKSGQSRVPKWAKSGQNRTGSLINFRRARWGPKVVPMWARGWPRSGQFSTGSQSGPIGGLWWALKWAKPHRKSRHIFWGQRSISGLAF